MNYIEEDRVHLTYRMPLGELIVDFYDQLKSRTQSCASLDYTFAGYGSRTRQAGHSGEWAPVDALSHHAPR
jgi:GTP-binding protein LepA